VAKSAKKFFKSLGFWLFGRERKTKELKTASREGAKNDRSFNREKSD